ncbi:MAG: hypothetical protein GY772_01345, partial [bacterium]|nr:hypothetical protein [bacterium]
MIFGNEYFGAHEGRERNRLPDAWQLPALQHLCDELDGGFATPVERFATKICRPLMLAAMWVRAKEAKYGAIATGSSAWARLGEGLKNDRVVRLAVLNCMEKGTKLEDGVVECGVLIKEFDKTKVGQSAPANPGADKPCPMPPPAASAEAPPAASAKVGYTDETSAVDFVQAAEGLASQEMKVDTGEDEKEREALSRAGLRHDEVKRHRSMEAAAEALKELAAHVSSMLVRASGCFAAPHATAADRAALVPEQWGPPDYGNTWIWWHAK